MAPSSKPTTLTETTLRTAETNSSQPGDSTALKADTSNPSTTPQKESAASSTSASIKSNNRSVAPAPTEGDHDRKQRNGEHKTLRQRAMEKLDENPSQLGDPVSLKAETADSRPTENDRGAAGGKSKL